MAVIVCKISQERSSLFCFCAFAVVRGFRVVKRVELVRFLYKELDRDPGWGFVDSRGALGPWWSL